MRRHRACIVDLKSPRRDPEQVNQDYDEVGETGDRHD